MTKLLYNRFPRQIAMPFRITVDKEKFYHTINATNGKKRLFSSIYNFTGNYEYDRIALKVDKVFFDFDGSDSLKHALEFAKECLNKEYKFIPFFSGGGFHIYVFTNEHWLQNAKVALSRFQTQFNGMDRTSVGDIARVATIPNTYNTRRGKFCIPISLDHMIQGYEYVANMATNQIFTPYIYGNSLVDLTGYDCPAEDVIIKFDEPKIDVRNVDSLPPCINDILSNAKKGFRGRFLIITYLKDMGYVRSQIEDLLREFCTGKEADHCIIKERQLDYLYWKDIMFPTCEQLKYEGRCQCDWCDFTREYSSKHLVKIYR